MSLKQQNFTVWCDFIEHDFLRDEFKNLIDSGKIHGATSNPTIFASSIQNSDIYKEKIRALKHKSTKDIYETIAIEDIKFAAKLLYPLYKENKDDGYISLEVDPNFCHDRDATIDEATRLHKAIQEPNLMIKVPATPQGIEAMELLASRGININATLVFSPTQARDCAVSLAKGMAKSDKETRAVVSVFVSRFDRVCNDICKHMPKDRIGVVNATNCYYEVQRDGNRNIRTLFASTGVKQDYLPQYYYIFELMLPHSVNTAPLSAINSFVFKKFKRTLDTITKKQCEEYMDVIRSKRVGIDIDKVSDELLTNGLEDFKNSFTQLLAYIDKEK